MFRNRIHLPNRYDYNHYLLLTKVHESGIMATYTVIPDSRNGFFRSAVEDTGEIVFIDLEGGPFIQKGNRVGRYTVGDIRMLDNEFLIDLWYNQGV